MQLIKRRSIELYILFTNWGRIGDEGQYQRTPFNTLADGVKEFAKVFKSKTGNDWKDIQNFDAQPKRYKLVDIAKDDEAMNELKDIHLDKLTFDVDIKSKIDVTVQVEITRCLLILRI
jgi:predicted DNA-binding WGR domain protein